VARLAATSLSDRIGHLQEQAEQVRSELQKLQKQEAYLQEQMEKAESQLAYYEGLLRDLRKRTHARPPLREVLDHL
jgi:predicted  nucleic acid-binding Zn-ribbon protein